MAKKLLFTSFLFFLFTFILTPHASAQSADCSTFSLNPSIVNVGGAFRVTKSDGLLGGQVVRATILGTSIPQQVLDCESSPSLCSENPVGLFEFDTSSLSSGTYTVEIFYFNGANTCTTTRSLSVTPAASLFCSPRGITNAFPLLFSSNEDIGFSGCVGAGTGVGDPCNGESRIVIINTLTRQTREIPITGIPGSCTSDGEFTRSVGGFDTGIYTAQLYIGTGSTAAPVGDTINFEVESGQDQQPDEGNPCTVIEAGLVCSGIFERDSNNQIRCIYEADQCFSCSQCVEPLCSAAQRGACLRSTADTAGKVAEGCAGGKGQVNTAIGCIPFDAINRTARFFIAWSLSIGGGVALLLVGVSGIMFATSAGNPKRVESAKSLFYAAITGLGMLVLSIFLLRFIGVDVLGIFG